MTSLSIHTALVTPTYYVLFTFCTLVTSIILFQGLDSTPIQIVTIVLGFLTICAGITLLQISKIDPQDLSEKDGVNIDRSTTLLIRASRSQILHEKGRSTGLEDPGVDTVRGGLGVIGSLVRARSSRRMHASSDEYRRMADEQGGMNTLCTLGKGDLERYELQDRPMPKSPVLRENGLPLTFSNLHVHMPQKRDTTISFVSGSEDPHGHHGGGIRSGSGNSTTTANYDRGEPHSAGGILRSPTQNNPGTSTFHSEPNSYVSTPNNSNHQDYSSGNYNPQDGLRPFGPRGLPRSGAAENISQMWSSEVGNGDLAVVQGIRPGPSPGEYSLQEEEDDKDYVEVGDETESSNSSPTVSKRSGGVFHLGGNSHRSKIHDDGVQQELLSPIMRNDLESTSGAFGKRRARG